MIRLQVMTDGRRDCISKTIDSALEHLKGPITEYVIHDDSGDLDNHEWLLDNFPMFSVHASREREGFGKAIISSWREIDENSNSWFVFHLEDDFIFNREIDLLRMSRVIGVNPHLAQMALRRQPWNDLERRAGGIVELNPDAYVEHSGVNGDWLEHRLFFTTNPCLYRTGLVKTEWPDIQHSEGIFSHKLLEEGLPWMRSPECIRFAFWGKRSDDPWVHHIGEQRIGTGY